jgi:AmmeMemoRadiSam system protein A
MNISGKDKRLLLKLARKRILGYLSNARTAGSSPLLSGQEPGEGFPEFLQTRCGAFVSLYVNEKLRGCIGTFSESEPLYRCVQQMALSAATSDSRFPPLMREEMDELKIEISVLSPRVRVSGPEDIVLGKHGIYIQKGSNRGTFLPQVALKQQWDVEEFLGHCSKYKAGLGWDGWKSAELYTFEAFVFNSSELDSIC